MARITWTDEAQSWLRDIYDYIAADNPRAAAATVEGIYERAQDLINFPELGARYRASSRHVRILVYGHYRIAYLVRDDDNIDILACFTARRLRAAADRGRQATFCRKGLSVRIFQLALITLLAGIVSRPSAVLAADNELQDPAATVPPAQTTTRDAGILSKVRVNGIALAYESRGKGDSVVFVHGGLVDYREWGPVARLLEDQYRTITYSRRYNYPNTNPFKGADHSAIIEGEDLASLIRELELAPVDIVGVSYGAYTAMVVARQYPQLVRSLTIVEPPLLRWLPELPGGDRLHDEFFAMWNASRDAFARGDSEAALRLTLDWFIGPNGMDQLPPEVLTIPRSNIEEWRALTLSRDAFPQITPEEVHEFKLPVLMISGGRSNPMHQLIDAELEKRLANGRRVVVPDATHDVCSEQPAICADAIRVFLEHR